MGNCTSTTSNVDGASSAQAAPQSAGKKGGPLAVPAHIAIHTIDDNAAMCKAAAEQIVSLAAAKWSDGRKRLTVALAGGSTPKAVYAYLAAHHPLVVSEQLELFYGDVRMVPDNHSDSNYAMVRDSLFYPPSGEGEAEGRRSLVDLSHVHSVDTSKTPSEAAQLYEEAIVAYFKAEGEGKEQGGDASGDGSPFIPRFDLVMLGFGPDGHTASLFPHTPAATESVRLVTDCMPTPNVSPLVARVTMTRPLIGAARHIMVLARGGEKKWVIDGVVSGTRSPLAVANRPAGDGAGDGATDGLPVAAFLRDATDAAVHLYVDNAAAPSQTSS